MDDFDPHTLKEAKAQYLKRLENKIFRPIYSGLLSVYEKAKAESITSGHHELILSNFQDKLAEIKVWNQDKINTEYTKVLESSGCKWLEDLITAVFVSQCKVYTSIRVTNVSKKFTLTIPKPENFIHQVYVECARCLWPYSYLFDDAIAPIKRQKNLRIIENSIREAIDETIGNLLPIEEITHEYTRAIDQEGGAVASEQPKDLLKDTSKDIPTTIDASSVIIPIEEIKPDVLLTQDDIKMLDDVEPVEPDTNVKETVSIPTTEIQKLDDVVKPETSDATVISSDTHISDVISETTVEKNNDVETEKQSEDNFPEYDKTFNIAEIETEPFAFEKEGVVDLDMAESIPQELSVDEYTTLD